MILSRGVSPAALSLQLFVISLGVGPLLFLNWGTETGRDAAFMVLVLSGSLYYWLIKHVSLYHLEPGESVCEGRPVTGVTKLLALLVTENPSGLRSLTGRSVVASSPDSGTPILCEPQSPSGGRLGAEAIVLLALSALWSFGLAWATAALTEWAFLGLVIAGLGSGGSLLTLLQRFGWGAGSYPITAGPTQVWAAPLIPSQGPNRFRAMVALDGRILIRPDLLGAPYLPYLLAHERAHLAARNVRLVWLEQSLAIAILICSGLSFATFGLLGLLVLLLFPLLRLLLCHLSYRSEVEADRRAAAELGVETCLSALELLAHEVRPSVLPRWQRYSPTILERIEHLKQRFNQIEV